MREEITSVGIDIGTSTTQLVFSRLVIENRASAYTIPRISISSKTIEYKSDIYDTPLLSNTKIDTEGLGKIVAREYERAGKRPRDIKTGAAIITGEAARKENAGAVLDALCSMAGDFVVATAGPELECILAAKGAGADVLSKERRECVANLDVGGGTTNIGLYKNGQLQGVCCLDIGGRLIKVEQGSISYVFPKIAELAERQGLSLKVGDKAEEQSLRPICVLMADQLSQALGRKPRAPGHEEYHTNGGAPLSIFPDVRAVTFSGGVADFIYGRAGGDWFRFGDVGPLLGEEIRNNGFLSELTLLYPAETIRATVVGAGEHTTEISGSTICFDRGLLPIKNLPVVRAQGVIDGSVNGLAGSIKEGLSLHSYEGGAALAAISLSGKDFTGFRQIQELAEAVIEGAQSILSGGLPLIIVLERDIAKALGQALRLRLPKKQGLICIDGISAHSGDYVDIGEPLAGGAVLPVVVKTLIFNT